MTKRLWILAALILVLSVISIPLVSAAPAWKKSTTTTPTATSTKTTTTPQVIERVVIVNNTHVAAQDNTPWYTDWNFIAVVLAVIGALVGWLISRRVRGKTAKYMSEIDRVYRSSNTSTNKCEAKLVGIRDQIEDDFKKGKINDQSLALLESRIDKYTRELRSGIVDRTTGIPTDLNKKIKHMLSDGVITKEEYAHFEEIVKKENMGASDKEEIRNLMKKWKDEDKR